MPEAISDDILLASVALARTALAEITEASDVGAPAGHVVEDERTFSLLFECTLLGYPGWYWTVSLGRPDDDLQPTVLEAELMPGAGALLAPDWVPWADRLAEYQASQEAAKAEAAGNSADASGDGDGEDDDDDDDEDDDDFEGAGYDSSDLDGVDIDSLHDDILHDDITGVELATLEQRDDEAENAERDADDSGPENPGPVDDGKRARKDK